MIYLQLVMFYRVSLRFSSFRVSGNILSNRENCRFLSKDRYSKNSDAPLIYKKQKFYSKDNRTARWLVLLWQRESEAILTPINLFNDQEKNIPLSEPISSFWKYLLYQFAYLNEIYLGSIRFYRWCSSFNS